MLILISSPSEIAQEATLINQFFDEGLDLFHLRKPNDTEPEVRALIEKIDSKHHEKISLHQHHQLANNYGIGRLHFSERSRLEMGKVAIGALKNEGYQLSTSVHSIEHLKLPGISLFDYSFIGPVFDSISKPGYKARVGGDGEIFQRSTKAVAIGGITASNLHELKEIFDGIAILGAVWCSPSPQSSFIEIRKIWNTKNQ